MERTHKLTTISEGVATRLEGSLLQSRDSRVGEAGWRSLDFSDDPISRGDLGGIGAHKKQQLGGGLEGDSHLNWRHFIYELEAFHL